MSTCGEKRFAFAAALPGPDPVRDQGAEDGRESANGLAPGVRFGRLVGPPGSSRPERINSGPVFCTRTGGYLDKKNVLRSFKAVVKAANRPDDPDPIPATMRFHDCRHTAASVLLSAGQSVRAVSRRLGRSCPEMTLRVYAHCLPLDDERLASEMDRVMGTSEIGCK